MSLTSWFVLNFGERHPRQAAWLLEKKRKSKKKNVDSDQFGRREGITRKEYWQGDGLVECQKCRKREATRTVPILVAEIVDVEESGWDHGTSAGTTTTTTYIEKGTINVALCQNCIRYRVAVLWAAAVALFLCTVILAIRFELNQMGFLSGLALVLIFMVACSWPFMLFHLAGWAANESPAEQVALHALRKAGVYELGGNVGEHQLATPVQWKALQVRKSFVSPFKSFLTVAVIIFFAWAIVAALNELGWSNWQ